MIEGKIANQAPRIKMDGNVRCGNCSKLIPYPERIAFPVSFGRLQHVYLTFSYIGTDYWIYETKSGMAVTYCSKYCRNSHNHRFQGN
jgi:hypothetical protein